MQDNTVRIMSWSGQSSEENPALLTREWIVTNGLGGFASSTINGAVTRRYHGLLVSALPAPLGRTVMLRHMHEHLWIPNGEVVDLTGEVSTDLRLNVSGFNYLKEFRMEMGLPIWRYEIGDIVLEKRVVLPHQQNTVHMTYRLLESSQPVHLKLRPSVHFRPLEATVEKVFMDVKDYVMTAWNDFYELSGGEYPSLKMKVHGEHSTFTIDRRRRDNILFRLEEARGYPAIGEHWTPGYFDLPLEKGQQVTLVASTDSYDVIASLTPEQALEGELKRRQNLLEIAHPAVQQGIAAELVLAADQFIITPAGRPEEAARARSIGDEVKTVIAGYHWFTDWGRDTMISLEGLSLVTGRHREAGYILRTFANYVRDGLIPNMFPEHQKQGLYHTADATLWFFHALHRYVQETQDRETLLAILPKLVDIVEHHLRGTLFNIGIDPEDGLLRQGQEGYQLTWMDAKVEGWVVTPRRGKAVELNALWYNALCLLEGWMREEQNDAFAQQLHEHAERARISFNARFWYEEGGYLYDVVDGEEGDDSACRPNQVFAISLDHPILDQARWKSVLGVVENKLLTPVGLRTLSSDHKDYKAIYTGNLVSRDAAYHQGTTWGWLIGPYIDAWLKVYPNDISGARQLLVGFEEHMSEAGLGTISEIFDAQEPFDPRGCIAQAWSVAEVLRSWKKCSESLPQDRQELMSQLAL